MGDVGMVILPSVLLPIYAWRHEGLFLTLGGVMWGFLLAFRVLGARQRPVSTKIYPPIA
jgi:hypothetical protein